MDTPNIVLILSDQHNANVLGYKDDQYIKTPNLDRLAQSGVSFDQCYCNAPLCVPSRTTLLTGQLPFKTNVYGNMQSLYSDHPTIAHAICNAGYETVLSGRMHFQGEDQHHGFEKRLVGDVTPFYHGYDFTKEAFEDLFDAFLPGPAGFKKHGAGMSSIYHFDNEVVKSSDIFLKERKDERPLFMTIGLSAPHPPFISEKESYQYYYDILPEPDLTDEFEKDLHPAIREFRNLRSLNTLKPEDIKSMRAAYYGLIEFLDTNVGRLIDSITTHLDIENTIIIYTSDHGEHMGNNHLIFKGSHLEDSVRIPMIVSYPEKYLQHTSIEEPTCMIDLSRTLLEMASAQPLPAMDGESLSDYLTCSKTNSEQRSIISQIGTYPKTFTPSAMIRKGDYKLISYHGYETPSLFNIADDPKEKDDLGTNEAYQELIQRLLSELNTKWDGQKVYDYCERAYEHYGILNEWSHTSKYEKRKNWKAIPGSNYYK